MLFVARDFAPEYWPMPVRIEAARAEVKRSGPRAVILRRNGVESRHDFRPRARGSASLTPATDVPSTRRRVTGYHGPASTTVAPPRAERPRVITSEGVIFWI